MTLYLVRHASAVRRSAWDGHDLLRPLSGGGHRQAARLAELLHGAEVSRMLASPYLRCRQTLEPLAALRGIALESDPRLAEGVGVGGARELLGGLNGESVVLCGHSDLVPSLVAELCGSGVARRQELRCEKGGVWILEGAPLRPVSASYVPPPPKKRRRDLDWLEPLPAPDGESPLELVDATDKLRVAVLDLGSTSFHLLVADATPMGEIRRVLRERKMLRLGASIATRGRIPEPVCKRAVSAARSLRRHADDADVERLLPVATAALRDARNGAELARRIGEVLGTPVRTLSGAEEAGLIFGAFGHRVAVPRGMRMGIDLGGGSLEIAVGDEDEVRWETTLRLGVARLHGELVREDPMSDDEERALRERVRRAVAPQRARIRAMAPGACVATGGTVSALARRLAARRSSWTTRAVGQLFVPRAELSELAEELAASEHRERLATPGLNRQRADLLPTGAVILDALLASLGLDGFTVSDWGLREGVILESLGLLGAGLRPGAAAR